jgi:hypothetical protein
LRFSTKIIKNSEQKNDSLKNIFLAYGIVLRVGESGQLNYLLSNSKRQSPTGRKLTFELENSFFAQPNILSFGGKPTSMPGSAVLVK